MCYSWWHYCHSALLAILLRKKIGKHRKEIGNLNGFEYRYLNGLKVPYYSTYPPLFIKVISMGMTQEAEGNKVQCLRRPMAKTGRAISPVTHKGRRGISQGSVLIRPRIRVTQQSSSTQTLEKKRIPIKERTSLYKTKECYQGGESKSKLELLLLDSQSVMHQVVIPYLLENIRKAAKPTNINYNARSKSSTLKRDIGSTTMVHNPHGIANVV
jgi:hypothetical protein